MVIYYGKCIVGFQRKLVFGSYNYRILMLIQYKFSNRYVIIFEVIFFVLDVKFFWFVLNDDEFGLVNYIYIIKM